MSQESTHPIDFRRLPGELQRKLVDLQTPADDRFLFTDRVSYIYLVPVIAAVGWLIYLYTASQQPIWEPWMFYLICGISMVIMPVAFLGLWRVLASVRSPLKSGYLITKDEFFKTNKGRIEVWSLKDLDAFRYKENNREIEVWIGEREETIANVDASDGTKLDRLFDGWKATAGHGVGGELRDPAYRLAGSSRAAGVIAGVLVSVVLGFLASYAFAALNRNFDDHETWTMAEQAGSIEQLENYKVRHPSGTYVPDADRKIGEQVAKVKADYLASVPKGTDPTAVAAFAALLERAASRPDRTIFVRVTETREIDDAVVDEMADQYRVTMNGYDVTVPASGSAFRKNKVFSDIRLVLTGSRDRGTIRFELSDTPPEDAPAIDVNLLIKSERLIFRLSSYSEGRFQTSNYPGASFLFGVDLKDGQASLYHMEYAGQPLTINSGGYDRRDKDNYSFDKVYFGTAMDGFDELLGKTFGLKANTESPQ